MAVLSGDSAFIPADVLSELAKNPKRFEKRLAEYAEQKKQALEEGKRVSRERIKIRSERAAAKAKMELEENECAQRHAVQCAELDSREAAISKREHELEQWRAELERRFETCHSREAAAELLLSQVRAFLER